jgi:hypothetical protein
MSNNQESRARLQTLLNIPERQRTDAEWDEIHELEIVLAPGNVDRPMQHRVPGAGNAAPPGQQPRNNNPNQQQPGKKKRFKMDHKRRGNRGPGPR